MRLVTIIRVQIIFTTPPKKNTRTQHIRNQTESQQRDETTNAERHRVRTKWTQEMNAALIDSRTEAEQLFNSSDCPKKENSRDCPKKENGRKIGIMELTRRIFDEKGYAYLQKNLRDQYANLMKTSKACSKAIIKEMPEQKDTEHSKDQECSQRIIYQYMHIDQRGCTTNSMGCIDNLIIDKTTLEEAKTERKIFLVHGLT